MRKFIDWFDPEDEVYLRKLLQSYNIFTFASLCLNTSLSLFHNVPLSRNAFLLQLGSVATAAGVGNNYLYGGYFLTSVTSFGLMAKAGLQIRSCRGNHRGMLCLSIASYLYPFVCSLGDWMRVAHHHFKKRNDPILREIKQKRIKLTAEKTQIPAFLADMPETGIRYTKRNNDQS